MKIRLEKIWILLFLPLILYNANAQNILSRLDSLAMRKDINFVIVFGVYQNDTYNHKFDAQERKWTLKNGILTYLIDAHNLRYSDTLALRAADLDSIWIFTIQNQLLSGADKDLSKDFSDKYGYTESIAGNITCNKQKAVYSIRANSAGSIDGDQEAKLLIKLEELLYRIVTTYRQ